MRVPTAGAGRAARAAVLVLVLALPGPEPLAGPAPARPPDDPAGVLAGAPPGDPTGSAAPQVPGPAVPGPVFVELAVPAAADVAAGGSGAAAAARHRIRGAADAVAAGLARVDPAARILYRTAAAVPGLAVAAGPTALRMLAAHPQVRSLRPLAAVTPRATGPGADRPAEGPGDGPAGAVARAAAHPAPTGEGVRIGIVDDGIDYTHAAFGGPGTPGAFRAVDPTRPDPAFPTPRVVGGVDLAGEAYDARSPDPARRVPHPDPNPLACGEHGTHVAATAAGSGVTADGATFTGDPAALTPAALAAMRVAPGVAPRAALYAIKIFGCAGGASTLVPAALEHALDPDGDGDPADRLDVVNLSLGDDHGSAGDAVSLFADALARHGVVVVAAAGNGGDRPGVVRAPAAAASAIAVASVHGGTEPLDAAEALAGAAPGPVPGRYGSPGTGLVRAGPVIAPPGGPGTGTSGGVAAGSGADGCDPLPPGAARGRIVWLEWAPEPAGRCGSATRARHAAAAGATGVLLAPAAGEPDGTGPDRPPAAAAPAADARPADAIAAGPAADARPSGPVAGAPGLPVFRLTAAAAARLRPALAAGTLRMRLDDTRRDVLTVAVPGAAGTVSPFSARGVTGPAPKPDLAAPGDAVRSARAGSGADAVVLSGTSMAAASVAGAAALVRQVHPGWTPEQVKAALVNTAVDGPAGRLEPLRAGAGRVDAAAAVAAPALAMAAAPPGAVGVGFGTVAVTGPITRSAAVRVEHTTGPARTYRTAYEAVTAPPGVRVTVTPARIAVAPGAEPTVTVTLAVADPAALRRAPGPAPPAASGVLVLRPEGGGPALRVPVAGAPVPVADLAAAPTDGGGLVLRGRGLHQGGPATGYRALVGGFALAAASPPLPVCGGSAPRCAPRAAARAGDLRAVGVATTPGAPGEGDLLTVAVATWAPVREPGGAVRPRLAIDVDGDAVPDRETTVEWPPGAARPLAVTLDRSRPLPGGGFAVLDARPLGAAPPPGGPRAWELDLLDTEVAVLAVPLAVLGDGPLGVRVTTAGRHAAGRSGAVDGVVDAVGPFPVDPRRPAVTVTATGPPPDGPAPPGFAPAAPGGRLRITAAAPARVLLLHPHNAPGRRIQVLGAATPGRP